MPQAHLRLVQGYWFPTGHLLRSHGLAFGQHEDFRDLAVHERIRQVQYRQPNSCSAHYDGLHWVSNLLHVLSDAQGRCDA